MQPIRGQELAHVRQGSIDPPNVPTHKGGKSQDTGPQRERGGGRQPNSDYSLNQFLCQKSLQEETYLILEA